jgi:hypothetical protein
VRRNIRIASISWLNAIPSPFLVSGTGAAFKPEWIPRTYMVLKATSNPAPQSRLDEFDEFRATKQYRALTYCHCTVETDDATGALTGFRINQAAYDPGWTPPLRFAECHPPLAPALRAVVSLRTPCWYAGEASTLSKVAPGHHPNSSIEEIPDGERVLVNALIKCRAGTEVDDAGLQLGSPFHVPWVWNEWLLTHEPGQLRLYVRASRFPSHAWFVEGRQVITMAGLGDATFPEEPPAPAVVKRGMLYSVPPPRQGTWVHLGRLALYPAVLSKGAPRRDPQAPNGDAELAIAGSVASHPNTVDGSRFNVVPL